MGVMRLSEPFKAKLHNGLLIVVLVGLVINLFFQLKNRAMLNSRARIQVVIIKNVNRHGVLTDAEQNLLSQEWNPAEYDFVEKNPFER